MPANTELVKSVQTFFMYCVVTVDDNSCYVIPQQHQMVKEQTGPHDSNSKNVHEKGLWKNFKQYIEMKDFPSHYFFKKIIFSFFGEPALSR